MSKFAMQSRVDRETYFKFKALAHSHGVSIERAIEALMRDALYRAGIDVRDDGPYADEGRQAAQAG
jgi:hypothetical protein